MKKYLCHILLLILCFPFISAISAIQERKESVMNTLIGRMSDICSISNYENTYSSESLSFTIDSVQADVGLPVKGDSICEAIIECGVDIVPYLLNKLDDTTITLYSPFMDNTYMDVGDVAALILDDVYLFNGKQVQFNLRDILHKHFLKDKYTEEESRVVLYCKVFCSDDEAQNNLNKKRLHRILRKKYVTLNWDSRGVNQSPDTHHILKK